MRCGNEPLHPPKRPMAVKHIEFKPIIAKSQPERLHLSDKHGSLKGPTNDNPQVGLRAFDNANRPTVNEHNQEQAMGQKMRITNLCD